MSGGKYLALVLTFFISICAFAEQPTEEQYWNNTGLNFEIVKTKFRGSCYKSKQAFVACIRALDDLAVQMKPAGIFALDTEVRAQSPAVGTLRKDYGPLKFYNFKAVTGATPATYWPTYKVARDLQIKYATDFYSQGDFKKVDFSAIIADLKPMVLTGDKAQSEGLLAGLMINSFLASAVDPHTHIQPLLQIEDRSKSLDVSYVGIGAIVKADGNQFIIQGSLPHGPALEAGLKPKDVISTIDGQKINGQDLKTVDAALKGTEGSKVKVGFLRNGLPLEVEITRATVVIPNLETEWVTDGGQSVGYMKLKSFGETDMCARTARAINEFQSKGAKGLILDLRGNGGGFLNAAVCIGSLFVGKRLIVKQVDIKGGKETDYIGGAAAITDLPLVVLIDGGSASASEILSGALQDYQRSWVLGDRSYGKATVQAEKPWDLSPRSQEISQKIMAWFGTSATSTPNLSKTVGLWHTISRFYQPSGRTNQIVGITPDFMIEPFPGATAEAKFALREADLYTNALPPVGPKWVEPRPYKVAKISWCMNQSELPKAIYEKKQDDAVTPDYPLISAQIVLACDH